MQPFRHLRLNQDTALKCALISSITTKLIDNSENIVQLDSNRSANKKVKKRAYQSYERHIYHGV